MPNKEVARLMRKYKKEELANMLLDAQHNKGTVLRTDGTINGTFLSVDGEQVQNLTSLRIRANLKFGIQLSYETVGNHLDSFERVWVYGENKDLSSITAAHREQRRAAFLASKKMNENPNDIKLWTCDHCWEENESKDENAKVLKCPICRQNTPKSAARIR